MSISRWSLPSRALARNKQPPAGLDSQERSSTVRVGESGLRQRGKLSNVFSTPFKKVENDRDVANEEHQPIVGRQQSPPYTMNALHASGLGPSHVPESPLTLPYDTSSLVDDATHSQTERKSRWVTSPFTPTPGAIGNLPYQHDQVPHQARYGNYRRGEGVSGSQTFAGSRELMSARMTLEEVRSRSSSYPSEGMRSPTSSPQTSPSTPATKELIAEYVQYGTLPTRALQQAPNTSIDHWTSIPSSSGQNSATKMAYRGNTNMGESYWEHKTTYSPLGTISGESSSNLRMPGGANLYSGNAHVKGTGDLNLGAPSEHEKQAYGQDIQELDYASSPASLSQTTRPESRNGHIQSSEPSSAGFGLTTVDDHASSIGHGRRQEVTTGTTVTLRSLRSTSTLVLDSRGLDSLEMPMLCRSWPPTSHTSDSTISQRIHQLRLKIKNMYKKSKVYFHHVKQPAPSSAASHSTQKMQAETRRANRKSPRHLLAHIRREKKKAIRKQKKAAKEIQNLETVPGKRWPPAFIPPRKRESPGISHHHDTILKRVASSQVLHKPFRRQNRMDESP